jgi:hypothetical protein
MLLYRIKVLWDSFRMPLYRMRIGLYRLRMGLYRINSPYYILKTLLEKVRNKSASVICN